MNDVYSVVETLTRDHNFSVFHVCDALRLSRSAYYDWLNRPPSSRQSQDEELMVSIRDIFWKHRRRYGTRRIRDDLADQEVRCGRRRIAKLLKIQGLRAIQPKSFVPKTTESRHTLGYSPNLLLDEPSLTTINQLWVGDITYIPLKSGDFLYLALLMDRFSRRVIDWNLEDHMSEKLVLPVLRGAIRKRQPKPGLIHHTDRGAQYAAHGYRQILQRAGMKQSMSRADNCYDNAFMESCNGTIKIELEMTEYESRRVALKEIGDYLDYYDRERKHSALDYKSPLNFETLQRG
jgi:putative transposase